MKTAIRRNSREYNKWVKRGRNTCDQYKVREARNSANRLIKAAKQSYYTSLGNKLAQPNIGHKHFWSAYKKIANKKNTTNIPPLINDGQFVPNSKDKADLFNNFFAEQCTTNDNGSVLPTFILKTDASLSTLLISRDEIINIIKHLDINKANGYDGISALMLRNCTPEVSVPLAIIFF